MALKKIGGLWLKDGQKGKFFSGQLELDGKKIDILVFKNDKGDNPKRPDYQIMLRDDEPQEWQPQELTEDDIPF